MANYMKQRNLTQDELKAIKDYAAANGRNWKMKLNHDWMNGHVTGHLQVIRNVFGPSWLTRFKIDQWQVFGDPIKIDKQGKA